MDVAPSRYPWAAITLALVLAGALSFTLVLYARGHVAQIRADAATLQEGRLRQADVVLDDYLRDSVHLADAVAAVAGSIRGNAALTRAVLVGFHRSMDDPAIFGLGIFYEPYAYAPNVRLYGPYVERRSGGTGTYRYYPSSSSYDYTALAWYRAARAAGSRLVFTHPYFEDTVTYLSVLRSFYDGTKLVGIVTVDSLPNNLVSLLHAPLDAADVAYVTDERGAYVIGTHAPPPGGRRTELSLPLRYAPWTLHLSTDASALDARTRSIAFDVEAAIAGIWLVAILTIAVAVRARRNRLLAETLRESAYHDSLTGLANRKYFLEELDAALRAMRESSRPFAVLFVDIDRFSVVNDSLGHGAGDELLKLIAARLRSVLPPGALLARLGGDEFTALVPRAGSEDGVCAIAESLLASVRLPFELNGGELYSGASIGIVTSDARYTLPEQVLRDADISMYEAKKGGRGRYAIFDEAMHARARAALTLESELHRALTNGEFAPFYQPIVHLSSGCMTSVEALVRWLRPNGDVTNAGEFVATAEQIGLLGAIDALVLARACFEAREIAAELGAVFGLSVNVSATHLTRTDVVAGIASGLQRSGLPAQRLTLEITETAIMENADDALGALNRLRELGVGVSVDDFGTGYSSLSYLRRLPITGLKIDRSFVTPLTGDAQSAAIVRSVVALAKTLGLSVTAEGVESEEQVRILVDFGVDYGQGYYFSKALDANELRAFVAAKAEIAVP